MRQLVYTMFRNNRPSFHLRWKENFLKHRKVSKYYETDSRSLNHFSPFYSKTNYIKPIEICFFSTHDIRLVLKIRFTNVLFWDCKFAQVLHFVLLRLSVTQKALKLSFPCFFSFFFSSFFLGRLDKVFCRWTICRYPRYAWPRSDMFPWAHWHML